MASDYPSTKTGQSGSYGSQQPGSGSGSTGSYGSTSGSTSGYGASSSYGSGSGTSRNYGQRSQGGMMGGNRGALIGVALAGAAVGFLANFGRKLMVQAPTAMAGNWDEGLAAEHAATLKLFDALLQTDNTQTGKRNMLFTQIRHALTKHSVQEETIVYPMLREHGMQDSADELNDDHGYIKQYFYDLENIPKNSTEWLEKARAFRNEVAEHAAKEENDIFPKARAQLSEDQNKKITAEMHKAGLVVA